VVVVVEEEEEEELQGVDLPEMCRTKTLLYT
jgi:hypothetical protein